MIKVTESNLLYVLTQLRKGDEVQFIVELPLRTVTYAGTVEEVRYEFEHSLPRIYFGGKHAVHSTHLSQVTFKGISKCNTYFPMLPLFPLYYADCPIYKVLYNKYGQSSQWHKTLFDIRAIQSCLERHGINLSQGGNYNHTKLKRLVLRLAPRCKIRRKDFIQIYRNDEEDLYRDYFDDDRYEAFDNVFEEDYKVDRD